MLRKVMVIMSIYNGEKYLAEQIESILKQKGVNLTLVIRDDGSTDRCPDIIKKYAEKDSRIIPLYGENLGFSKSFFNTFKNYYTDDCDYYAFSDQDDVWLPDKLFVAVNALDKIEKSRKMYASSLNVVDQNLNLMYVNSFTKLKISYGSALSRQRLSGCTMLFDRELAKLCLKLDMEKYPNTSVSHDEAIYLICLACGGSVYFDKTSYINFRRHMGTVTEHGQGFRKRLESITNIFGKNKNKRYELNKAIFETYNSEMPDEVKDLAKKIILYRSNLKDRLELAIDKRIKCNIFPIDVFYAIAILCGYY